MCLPATKLVCFEKRSILISAHRLTTELVVAFNANQPCIVSTVAAAVVGEMVKFTLSRGKYFAAGTTWTLATIKLLDRPAVLVLSFLGETSPRLRGQLLR
jgi:hypothetical protein